LNVTQQQIEVFRSVMINRSVTKAAQTLRSSQPTTSRVLAELERAIGFRLFTRDRKRMVPTPDGIAFFQEVQNHFVGLEELARAANRISQFHDRTLHIATIPSVSFGLLPLAVPGFRERYPAARVAIEVRTFESVVHDVLAAQCDIGFTAYPSDRPGIVDQRLITCEAVCVMPTSSPLAQKAVIAAEDLDGLPFVSLEMNAPSRRRIDEMFERRGVRRQLVLETQNGAVVCALVKNGAGVAVVDPFSAYSFADPALTVRPLQPRLEFTFYVLWRADLPPSRFATAFVDQIRDAIAGQTGRIPVIDVA